MIRLLPTPCGFFTQGVINVKKAVMGPLPHACYLSGRKWQSTQTGVLLDCHWLVVARLPAPVLIKNPITLPLIGWDMIHWRDRKPRCPGPRFNTKISSYQYRKSHCADKTILRPSYLHNGISYTGKTASLYWIRALTPYSRAIHFFLKYSPYNNLGYAYLQKLFNIQQFAVWSFNQSTFH